MKPWLIAGFYARPVPTYYAAVRPPSYTLHRTTLTLTQAQTFWATNWCTRYSHSHQFWFFYAAFVFSS